MTISVVMSSARPQKNDPMMKIATLIWKTRLRPNRSPNLPASTRGDGLGQDVGRAPPSSCAPDPPRSPTIVGSAVDTMVWSSAESSIPSTIVAKMTFIWLRVSAGVVSEPVSGSSVVVSGATPELYVTRP